MGKALSFAVAVSLVSGCAAPGPSGSGMAPSPDPRVGLDAGWMDAEEAAWNLRLVSTTARPAPLTDREDPGNFAFMNSDLAFRGDYVIQGNFSGIQIWDLSDARTPKLVTAYICPGAQNDVSVYADLLFVSAEALNGRVDCGTQGVQDSVSQDRMRGIRIFDISDIASPKPVANVQTCRGSHTHTLVRDPADTENVYIYVSGSAPVRSPNELAGCSALSPDEDPNSSLFRIEVIRVPLAEPKKARVVSTARLFTGLVAPPSHGPAPEDSIAAARVAEQARARGAFTAFINGMERVLSSRFIDPRLEAIVKARGGTGAATAADSAALREALPDIIAQLLGDDTGPTQCHDITVYSAIGLAGGACGGYGLLIDIRDVVNPRRIAAAADSNFAFWHSATFNNDGTQILFTDEWGGGLQPRCRATDRPEWGANAIFTIDGDRMTFQSYYKIPAAQTRFENCVAHNGSLIPVPGRDLMVQGWYQGGISVLDWTDPANPREIAYFDRGPMDPERLLGAGSWSAYWYNGYIVSSEIARGLDVLELTPSAYLSQNEIDAAKSVRFEYLNVQDQPKLEWPAGFAVPRAILDQLERSNGLAPERVAAAREVLTRAETLSSAEHGEALAQLAAELDAEAGSTGDPAKVRALAAAVEKLADAQR